MEIVEGTAEIEDVGKFVADLEAIGADHGVTVQAFDARYIVDRAHLETAVDLACREMDRGTMIADDRGIEILLYAAGRRQINRAMEMGLREGACPIVAVVVDCENHDWTASETVVNGEKADEEAAAAATIGELLEDETVLETVDHDRVCSYFDITERELEATTGGLSDLVRERVALLIVER